jgi:hypothetical protein
MPPAFLRKVVGEPPQELPAASSEGKAMQSEESTPVRKTPD